MVNKSVADLKKMKEMAGGIPLIVKGVLTVEGARKCVEAGADAIVVSNHGGRVLDDALSTIEVLPEIAAAVKGQITILVDGGFRTGLDVFKALALGADGVLIGRPLALAAVGGGKEGVRLTLDKILQRAARNDDHVRLQYDCRDYPQSCSCRLRKHIK